MTEQLSKAQERIKTALAEFINLKHPVALVVDPLREKAMERAEVEAKKIVEKVRAELKAAGNDLEVCAPYPDSGKLCGAAYHSALGKYRLFRHLCKSRKGSRSMREPNFADVDSNYVAKYIKDAKTAAAFQYDAFIVKLCLKIGDCVGATITGEHVWGRSQLRVAKMTGPTEVWMTQQIVNCSKLGLLFNQWPSRKIKQ